MTVQTTFLPREEFIASKPLEERIAYVKANPGKYMPKAEYDIIKELKESNLILQESNKSIHEKLDLVMNQILAKK